MGISTKFTYEDLQHFPSNGNRYEIVEGDLFVSPAPIPLHQTIVGNLYAELRQHIRKHRLGVVFVAPCDVVLASSTVLEPDIFFVSAARRHIIGEKNLSGPPDLVVEVLSESSGRMDRDIKFRQYALHGVPEYWLVDPYGRTVQIFREDTEGVKRNEYQIAGVLGVDDRLTTPLLPGLSLPVGALWDMG